MKKLLLLIIVSLLVTNCVTKNKSMKKFEPIAMLPEDGREVAIFAGGCFWCTEAIFLELKGVESVTSGYTGGTTQNPTYEDVCLGYTGHAEAIKVVFNPDTITYAELLEIFFSTHDPTTLNRQGADVGSQYRSEIYATTTNQKQLAKAYIDLLNQENTFGKTVVTNVSDATTFYVAENYHQNYYNLNRDKSYCTYVITPKIDKVREVYEDKLK